MGLCGAASPGAAPPKPALKRDIDRNSLAGITAVVHVVAVVLVADVHIVVVVPVIAPAGRPGIDRTDPIALILEARISAYHQKGEAADAESVARAKVPAVPVLGDTVAAVAAALLPVAVVGLPVL